MINKNMNSKIKYNHLHLQTSGNVTPLLEKGEGLGVRYIFTAVFILFSSFLFSQSDSTINLKNGIAKFNEGNYDVATMEFNKAVNHNPTSVDAYYYLGKISYLQKDLKKAMEDFNKVLEMDSLYSKAYKERGVLKATMEDYHGAIDDFDMAIKINKKFSEAYFNRGMSYLFLKDYKSSITDFTKVIDFDKKDFQAYEQRGTAKFQSGDAKGACKDWSKAGELGDFKIYDIIKKNCK